MQLKWTSWMDAVIIETAREYPREPLSYISSVAARRLGISVGAVEGRLQLLRRKGLLPERPWRMLVPVNLVPVHVANGQPCPTA